MGLFKSLYRILSPKSLIDRQRMLIQHLKALDSNFEIIVKSNEEVLLRLPKSGEGEEIVIILTQLYNSPIPQLRKILFIKYRSTIDGEPIEVELNFEDPTPSLIMLSYLIDKVKKESQKVKDKVKYNTNILIFIEDWQLLNFAKEFGKMQVGTFRETETGIVYKACLFTNPVGIKTYVYFHSELGELSPSEISKRKNELYVGKAENGNYFLYSKNNKGWALRKQIEKATSDNYIKRLNHHIAESYKTKGIEFDEEAVMSKYKELCQTVYDGSEDYEVNLLTRVQKLSLFGLITLVGTHEALANKSEQVEEIKKDFADTIKLSDNEYDEVVNHALKSERTYIHIIKDIHLDYPINMLFDSWRELSYLDDSTDHIISNKLVITAGELGFTDEESQELTGNRYVHKYS